MRSIYLAGSITGKTFADANRWRKEAAEILRPFAITCLSPLRGKEALESKGELHHGSYPESPLTLAKGFVARDRFDVQRADLVLANFEGADRISIGTMVELGWADAYRKPIVMIPGESDLYNHGFLQEIVPYRVASLDEACKLIIHLFEV